MARQFGIDAFCYYHDWFNGKELMETPLQKMLADKECDMPFCLCWANETWSRAWDGKDREILIEQTYNRADDQNHARHLCEIFKDERYLKSQGKPVFIIYRVGKLDAPADFVKTLDEAAKNAGFSGVRVFAVRNFACDVSDEQLASYGIEDIVDFQPNNTEYPSRSALGKGIRLLQRKWNDLAKKIGLPALSNRFPELGQFPEKKGGNHNPERPPRRFRRMGTRSIKHSPQAPRRASVSLCERLERMGGKCTPRTRRQDGQGVFASIQTRT